MSAPETTFGGELMKLDAPELGARLHAVFDQGRLLALPTETVYGLAAPIDRPDLIARVFEFKGRPPDNPLIVHVGDLEQARRVTREWPEAAERLARAFWPGPLTLVLPRSDLVSDAITAGRDTVAVRMPDHPVALAMLRALDVPLVAPSANLFTRLSPTRAEDVRAVFPAQQVEVIDGGPCRVGIESTIVGIDSRRRSVSWLRPGQIDRAAIHRHLPVGWSLDAADDEDPAGGGQRAPGRMREHYRPSSPLHVHVYQHPAEAERLRAQLGNVAGVHLLELPEQADAVAQSLYRRLRAAEADDVASIELLLDARCLKDSSWEGIVNRLRKAATAWRQVDGPDLEGKTA